MQDLEFNTERWKEEDDWSEDGEQWSLFWGDSDTQWHSSILPRIKSFVPAKHILEIAPGNGRWTRYLKDLCEELTIVDLTESCIERCKNRFSNEKHINYFVNDGLSLSMIQTSSIDFLFTFDSLVHVDVEVLDSYISQLSRILKDDGVAFIHHSNAREYKSYFGWTESLPRGRGLLNRLGLIDMRHLRNTDVSYKDVLASCKKHNLHCNIQELISWGGKRQIDCISVISKRNTKEEPKLVRNDHFMTEASLAKKISSTYEI